MRPLDGRRLRVSARTVTTVLDGPLRRAHLSFAAMWAAESAFMVALSVLAFRDGGVAAVGLVTAVRMAAAALLTPFLATVADRTRRERVLTGIGIVRATILAAAALVAWGDGPPAAIYAFAVIATLAMGLYRPAHSALLPLLAKSPQDLTAANAVRGLLDSLSTFGGPALAAALLVLGEPSAVFGVCAALSLLGGLVVVAMPYDAPPRQASVPRSTVHHVLGGFRTIAGDRTLALVTALGAAQTFVRGCLTVFAVVVAFDLLDTGNTGVAVLNSAVGAGGIVGSLAAFTLVRRGGLATWFGVGVALFGAPLALVGMHAGRATAIVLLGLTGVGNALIDVSGFTILARLTDETVLARMFAGFEAVLTLGIALGGVAAPLLVTTLGTRHALVAVGLLTPLAVALSRTALRRLDGRLRVRDADIRILRGVPMLGALPAATIEQLGARLSHEEFPAGDTVFEQGDRSGRYYVIESGRAEVVQHNRVVNTLGPGDGFGEVALLGDSARTAGVRAAESLRVAVLERAAFLTAVTQYPVSATLGRGAVEEIRSRDASRPATGDEDGEPPPTGVHPSAR